MSAQTWRVGSQCLLLLALVGSIRSEGVQSCEEVRKLFQGRLVGPVKGLPDSPRAGKARTVGEGWEPGHGLGRPERGPCTAQALGMAFRGRSWPFRSSDRTRCLPEKGGVTIPSAAQLRELQDSACCWAELRAFASRPAPLVSLMRCKRPAELTAGDSAAWPRFFYEWELPQCPAGGPWFAAFFHGRWSWVGRSKFDTKNTNLHYPPLLENGVLTRAAGVLCYEDSDPVYSPWCNSEPRSLCLGIKSLLAGTNSVCLSEPLCRCNAWTMCWQQAIKQSAPGSHLTRLRFTRQRLKGKEYSECGQCGFCFLRAPAPLPAIRRPLRASAGGFPVTFGLEEQILVIKRNSRCLELRSYWSSAPNYEANCQMLWAYWLDSELVEDAWI